jgi:hypothetical protein
MRRTDADYGVCPTGDFVNGSKTAKPLGTLAALLTAPSGYPPDLVATILQRLSNGDTHGTGMQHADIHSRHEASYLR